MKHNESAISYAWLKDKLGFTLNQSPNLVAQAWEHVRKQMLSTRPNVVYLQSWISDFWLARSSESHKGTHLVPVWDPPEKVDEWPALGVHHLVDGNPFLLYRTNNNCFQNLLSSVSIPAERNSQTAVDRFTTIVSEINVHADTKMVQKEHVKAWLATAIGHFLMGVILSPQHQADLLAEATIQRLMMPRDLPLPSIWVNEFEDRRLEQLYNSRPGPYDTTVSTNINIRIGQGEQWRDHWAWLSRELPANEMIEAVQLAASLMRCEPLLKGLIKALQSGDDYLKTVSLAVLRRWLLTLKVMVWLEDALVQPWTYMRTPDLACFAFNAVKPDWPHRVVGISHRSSDVKPLLAKTSLWTSGRCAIDSNYVPSWETNTGMIWGLFATTPFITTINSDNYKKSIWCLREYEIINYLVYRCDFLSQRWVYVMHFSTLDILEQMFTSKIDYEYSQTSLRKVLTDFPPMCNVWTPTNMPEWEVKMFRVSAALRIMCCIIYDPSITNEVAMLLEKGSHFTYPCPTNNSDGWHEYATIFRDFRAVCNSNKDEPVIRLPINYDPEQEMLDFDAFDRIPDLSAGTPALRDILVAYEWVRTEWPLMLREKYGDFILINCQGLTKDQWLSDERLSLWRGLAAFNAPVPVWFLQTAGQDIETWPLVGQRPIFTEHAPHQFSWMWQMFLNRQMMQSQYPKHSGLILSEELKKLCST